MAEQIKPKLLKKKALLIALISSVCALLIASSVIFIINLIPMLEFKEKVAERFSAKVLQDSNAVPWEKFDIPDIMRYDFLRNSDPERKTAIEITVNDTELLASFVYRGNTYSDYLAEQATLKAELEELESRPESDDTNAEIASKNKRLVRLHYIIENAEMKYKTECAKALHDILDKLGYDVIRKSARLYLHASYNELSRLIIENSDKLYFDIGNKSIFLDDSSDNNSDSSYLRKLSAPHSGILIIAREDADIAKVINEMITDSAAEWLEFEFSFASYNIDLDIFDKMNAFDTESSWRQVSLKIKFEDIDPDALLEIIKKDDIDRVYIKYPPSSPSPN